MVRVVDGGNWTRCRTTEAGAGLWAAGTAAPELGRGLEMFSLSKQIMNNKKKEKNLNN